jgi:hypothetical protein
MEGSRTKAEILMIILLAEKVIQHIFVTWAFYVDFMGIRSTVVVSWEALMIAGAGLTVLFLAALIARIKGLSWGLPLVGFLALCDIIGEFIAQGTLQITIMVSFVVAWILLILVILECRRKNNEKELK